MVTNKKGNAVARFDEWAGNKQLFHNMTLGFALHEMIADPEGRPLDYRFMIVNKAYERLTGLRRADVVGRRASEIKVGFDPAWVETFGEVVATGRPVCFQSYSATLNKYFEIRAYRPAAGLFAMMLQDITDRLNDEHALAERERLLRVVLATTGEGFFIADSRGRIGSVNRSYCDMMGYTEEELLGMTLQEQSDGVRPEQIKGRLDRIRRSGHDTFETRHRRKDGSVIDVEVTSSYLDEGEGQFVAFVRDITERKKAERLYREQGERLELALRGTGAGLWDWNVQTGEIILDRNWERILGYPDDEVREATMDRWGELCHPEDLRRSAVVFAKHMAGDLPRYECEIRIRHRDGHWVWALNQGELVERDGAGRPLRMIGLMFDIGAQKGIEEKLRVALSEKESLLSELYHRTKNSMQLINAMLELKKQELNDAEAETAFEDIENKILAMALVQEKLYQSDRLDSIDLGSYMTDLVELLKNEMPATATAIAFAAQGSSIKVSADIAIPCGLIMSELIGNSIGHAFPERESGRIAVSVCEEDDGGISIEEWDDGVGLPSGFNPRMAGRVGLRTVIGIGEEQLHGKISFGNKGGGFSCKITFKDLYYPKRV
jgi:PAS domain S-box-containing protein